MKKLLAVVVSLMAVTGFLVAGADKASAADWWKVGSNGSVHCNYDSYGDVQHVNCDWYHHGTVTYGAWETWEPAWAYNCGIHEGDGAGASLILDWCSTTLPSGTPPGVWLNVAANGINGGAWCQMQNGTPIPGDKCGATVPPVRAYFTEGIYWLRYTGVRLINTINNANPSPAASAVAHIYF